MQANWNHPNKPHIKAYSQYHYDWLKMVNNNYPNN